MPILIFLYLCPEFLKAFMRKDILIQYIGKDKGFNVFEEGVDQQAMEDFHDFRYLLSEDDLEIQDLDTDIAELSEEGVAEDYLKLLLVKLSNVPEVKAYRALEKYVKQAEGEMKKWAVVALQQSRALVEGSLSDDDKVFIISGLGGQADKLRYFAVINTPEYETLSDWQKETIEKELQYNAELQSAVVEEINFGQSFATVVVLIPVHKSVAEFFKVSVDNINELGNFLSDVVVVTNTKRFSQDEVHNYLRNGPEALFEGEAFDEFYDEDFDDDDDYDEYDPDDGEEDDWL